MYINNLILLYSKHIAREYCYYDLIIKRGFTKTHANKLLTDLYAIIDISQDKTDKPVCIEDATKVVVKYKEYSINISNDCHFITNIHTNTDAYLNSIMLDNRPNIIIPQIIFDIIEMIKYDNLYEISNGIHDMIFHGKFGNMNITHYTYYAGLSKPISELELNKSKTIVFGFQNTYIRFNKNTKDTLFILMTLDTPDLSNSKYQTNGYRIQVPLKSTDFMKNPINCYATHISFHFYGPSELLYMIKNKSKSK